MSSGSLCHCIVNTKFYRLLFHQIFLRKNDTEPTTIDKIVTVCATLTNICVAPFE